MTDPEGIGQKIESLTRQLISTRQLYTQANQNNRRLKQQNASLRLDLHINDTCQRAETLAAHSTKRPRFTPLKRTTGNRSFLYKCLYVALFLCGLYGVFYIGTVMSEGPSDLSDSSSIAFLVAAVVMTIMALFQFGYLVFYTTQF